MIRIPVWVFVALSLLSVIGIIALFLLIILIIDFIVMYIADRKKKND